MNRPVEFDRAVLALHVQLRAFALSLTRNRDNADDLVQDTIVQALLYSMNDTPYEDILREQGGALGTVKSRLNRARKQLAEMVA